MAELQSVGWRPPMLESHNVQIVDHRQIAELATRARAVPRKRTHLLLHEGPADPVQRLIIVLQPNTYVRPHHHSRQWEMLVLQQGRGNLLIFDGGARLTDRIELSPRSFVVQIPTGVWHGFLVLEPNTAVLEIKPGPYLPNEFADWRQRKETQAQIDLWNGPRTQRLERDGRLPNEPQASVKSN
jgi:cupin fold WbuC family metalloprotein